MVSTNTLETSVVKHWDDLKKINISSASPSSHQLCCYVPLMLLKSMQC